MKSRKRYSKRKSPKRKYSKRRSRKHSKKIHRKHSKRRYKKLDGMEKEIESYIKNIYDNYKKRENKYKQCDDFEDKFKVYHASDEEIKAISSSMDIILLIKESKIGDERGIEIEKENIRLKEEIEPLKSKRRYKDKKNIRNMFKIGMDWLSDIITDSELSREYLYKTLNFFKKYVCAEPEGIALQKLQLVFIVCLMIINKFDENPDDKYKITVDYTLYVCNNEYNKEEIVNMEQKILNTLKWDANVSPSPHDFYDIYVNFINLNPEEQNKVKFLLEYGSFNLYENILPSNLALAAILLSKNITYKDLSDEFKIFLDLDENELKLVNRYVHLLRNFYKYYFKENFEKSIENMFK